MKPSEPPDQVLSIIIQWVLSAVRSSLKSVRTCVPTNVDHWESKTSCYRELWASVPTSFLSGASVGLGDWFYWCDAIPWFGSVVC